VVGASKTLYQESGRERGKGGEIASAIIRDFGLGRKLRNDAAGEKKFRETVSKPEGETEIDAGRRRVWEDRKRFQKPKGIGKRKGRGRPM